MNEKVRFVILLVLLVVSVALLLAVNANSTNVIMQ